MNTCERCGGPRSRAFGRRCRPCYFADARLEFEAKLGERFWSKVDRRAPAECWLWLGSRDDKGYGRLDRNKRIARAHRLAWELTHGPIPDGLVVRHRCDNPPCVNPAHLLI